MSPVQQDATATTISKGMAGCLLFLSLPTFPLNYVLLLFAGEMVWQLAGAYAVAHSTSTGTADYFNKQTKGSV